MRHQKWLPVANVVGGLLLTTSCGLLPAARSGSETSAPTPDTTAGAQESPAEPSAVEDAPLSWGPTPSEVDQAREAVDAMSAPELAGQVIVGRYFSTDPQEAATLVEDLHLAGVCVTAANVTDADQVRATTAAVEEAHGADGREWPAVIGVDEEGGSVAHLSGIATTFPAFQTAGTAIDADREQGGKVGRKAVQGAAEASGLELRDFGFTWVFAPVADVTIGQGDPTIGTRSPSMDPRTAATAAAAAVRGYDRAGIVSTPKHFPGHGSALADSHETLPVVDRSLDELRKIDLLPFKTSIKAHAPAVMLSHLDVTAIAPDLPASLAPAMYDFLRVDMGFEGVSITDSMGMGAVATREKPAVAALNAGADLILMPADPRSSHATITEAIETGEISDERIREAATRVVALQLWQQRVSAETPVPDDVTQRAETAADALIAAASR